MGKKRATIYFEDGIYEALRVKAFEVNESVSGLVNDALGRALAEDLEDLSDAEKRRAEKPVTYAKFLKGLKNRGQI